MVHGDEANQNLVGYLDERIPYFTFAHMGTAERKFPFNNLNAIAKLYVNHLIEHLPNKELVLTGYSIGGVLAYEMTQQLTAQGYIVHLILLDSKVPRLKSDFEYHNRQVRWNESKISKAKKRISKKLTLGFYKVTRVRMKKEHFYHLRMQQYRKARKNYRVKPIDLSIHLIRSLQYNFKDPYLGWKEFVKGNITVKDVDCSHHELTFEPHVQEVAAIYNEIYSDIISIK